MTDRKGYSVKEATAAIGKTDTKFVLAEIAAGRLRAKRMGRAYLIPSAELDAWIEALPDA